MRHDDLAGENILDWGLEDPNGFRGYGGGNEEPAIVGEQAASRSYLAGPLPAGPALPPRRRAALGGALVRGGLPRPLARELVALCRSSEDSYTRMRPEWF